MNLNVFELCLLELYKQSLKRGDLAVAEHLLQALEVHSERHPGTSNVLAQAYLGGVERNSAAR